MFTGQVQMTSRLVLFSLAKTHMWLNTGEGQAWISAVFSALCESYPSEGFLHLLTYTAHNTLVRYLMF